MEIIAQSHELQLIETDTDKGIGYVLNTDTGEKTQKKAIISLLSMANDWIPYENINSTLKKQDNNIYDWIDNTLEKSGVSIGGKQPWGAKQIGKMIEQRLYRGLYKTVDDFLAKLVGNERKVDVINSVNDLVKNWVLVNTVAIEGAFEALFKKGFMAGAVSEGMAVEDKNAMEILKAGRYRIGSRIKLFADDVIKEFAAIIEKSYTVEGIFDLNTLVKEMHQVIPAQRYELERIARTETSQVSNIGRIWAWSQDDNRYFYKYNWQSTPDNRRREIKKMRSEGNPFSYDEIKFLWLNNEQRLPNGKWQNGSINCRCSVSRSPNDEELKGDRFQDKKLDFRKTVEIDF